MKYLVAIMLLLCGCTTLPPGEYYAKFDSAGNCTPNVFSPSQANACLTWAAMTHCDQRFRLYSSWRYGDSNGGGRPPGWIECTQDRYDYLAGSFNAQRQATGQALMQSGTELLREPESDSFTCTAFGNSLQCDEN